MNTIRPSTIRGTVAAPASKSDVQRAIAAATLAQGRSVIERATVCGDIQAAAGLSGALGASVSFVGDSIVISGGLNPLSSMFDCGESGLSLRLYASVISLLEGRSTMTGRGTLLRRPLRSLESALSKFGVTCQSADGFLPLSVKGPLKRGIVTIDASDTSQHATGLLFALPHASGDSELTLSQPVGIPYLRMTLSTLRRFGVTIDSNEACDHFRIPGGQAFIPTHVVAEGDWSASAFLLVAGALAGEVTMKNLNVSSPQADRAVIEVLQQCGADIIVGEDQVVVRKGDLRAFSFDGRNAPDLFPPLAALACFCRGTSILEGTDRLAYKESNRAETLLREFTSLGADIRQVGNRLEITGGEIRGGQVATHNDHRIAMAASVVGLRSRNGVTLDNPSCVSKSYPDFFRDLGFLSSINEVVPQKGE